MYVIASYEFSSGHSRSGVKFIFNFEFSHRSEVENVYTHRNTQVVASVLLQACCTLFSNSKFLLLLPFFSSLPLTTHMHVIILHVPFHTETTRKTCVCGYHFRSHFLFLASLLSALQASSQILLQFHSQLPQRT